MIHIKDFYSSLYKQRSLQTEAECLEYLSRINIPGPVSPKLEVTHVKAFLLKGNAGKP